MYHPIKRKDQKTQVWFVENKMFTAWLLNVTDCSKLKNIFLKKKCINSWCMLLGDMIENTISVIFTKSKIFTAWLFNVTLEMSTQTWERS